MAPKKLVPPTHVSDHECFDFGMSDVLRHDTFYTFVKEHTKQNNRISIYFKTGILRYMNTSILCDRSVKFKQCLLRIH